MFYVFNPRDYRSFVGRSLLIYSSLWNLNSYSVLLWICLYMNICLHTLVFNIKVRQRPHLSQKLNLLWVILYYGRSLCMCFRSYLEYLLEDFVNFDLGLLRDPSLAGGDILICFMLTELSLKLMWAVTVCWFALCSVK